MSETADLIVKCLTSPVLAAITVDRPELGLAHMPMGASGRVGEAQVWLRREMSGWDSVATFDVEDSL